MRQALELALKALEEFGEHYNWCHQFPTYASPEEYPPCNCGYDKAITAIKEALAQPEQEPDKYLMDIECTKCGAKQSGVLTVNTTPPQRTWVGLTDDDEIPWDGVDAKSFAKAIEAKLKDKNL